MHVAHKTTVLEQVWLDNIIHKYTTDCLRYMQLEVAMGGTPEEQITIGGKAFE